ncbi:MAG: hypothetical protein FWH29_08595 [Methanobrevibacter sp.]|nr:hypothetical protein [Methanobrevibacter sp.]
MVYTNENWDNNSFIFDIAEITFSKFTELLEFLKHKVFEKKREFMSISPDTFNSAYKLFNHTLDAYKSCIKNVLFMEKEIYPITEIQDILDYFFNENFENIAIEELEFAIRLIEAYSNFYIKNAKLRRQYFPLIEDYLKEPENYMEKYVLEYNALFDEYFKTFNNQENEFYNNFYTPKGEYNKSINETFKILGRL